MIWVTYINTYFTVHLLGVKRHPISEMPFVYSASVLQFNWRTLFDSFSPVYGITTLSTCVCTVKHILIHLIHGFPMHKWF